MHAQDAADADRVEPTVVDQPPDRLGMDAELIRYLANADEPRLSICRRHVLAKPCRSWDHPYDPSEPMSMTVGLPLQEAPYSQLELPRRDRSFELRLDPAVAADEKRPGL